MKLTVSKLKLTGLFHFPLTGSAVLFSGSLSGLAVGESAFRTGSASGNVGQPADFEKALRMLIFGLAQV